MTYVPDHDLYPREYTPYKTDHYCPLCGERIISGEEVVSIDRRSPVYYHRECFEDDMFDLLADIGVRLFEMGE